MVQSSGDKNKIIKQIIQKLRQQSKWLIKVLWQKIVELYRLSFWQSNDWLKYAEKQSQLGDLEGGLNACNQALKRDATNYLAWHKKGLILVKLKYDDEALASYDKALKINPNTDLVWVSKGDLLSTQQQTRAAADCYQQALKINPQNTQVTIKLNSLLEQLKQTVESLLIEGDKLYKSKDFQSATTIYQQAITLRPDLDTSWYKFGNCLFALNKYQEAINAYNQTLQINPKHYGSLFYKGNVFYKLQNYQAAIDCYDQALIIKPDLTEIVNQRELAVKELQKLELYIENMLNKGIALYESEKYEEALKIYDQALEIVSKNLVTKS